MTIRRGLLIVTAALALVTGCKGATEPGASPVSVGPTNVVITAASAGIVVTGCCNYDQVTYTVQNKGGPGSYYVEFWSEGLLGRVVVLQSSVVTVLTGYTESLVFNGTTAGVFAYAMKVWSQPVNTAVATLTDCRVIRASSATWCP